MNGGVFEVKATGGDTHLGGEDFDNLVVNWCKTQIAEKHGKEKAALFDKSNRAMSRLRRACETAKRALSSGTSTTIEVDSLVEDVDFNVTLTRAKFEELNAKLFQDCMDTVTAVLKDAGVKNSEVTDIVLVGGSTRVPILQTKLGEMFAGRIELCKSIHPDEAVAIGAAVQGHILSTGGKGGGQDLGVSTDLLLLDVTPLSLGIELEGRVMSTLIKRNTAIPCKKTRTYSTVDDWQTEIDVVVYEGERPHIDGNNKLGSFVISGVQKARAGEPKVDVTFSLDANGILVVSAEDQVTGAKANAEIKAEAGRLTKEEVDNMIADAEKYKEADDELAKKLELKSLLEEAIFECNTLAKEKKDDAGATEIENMMDWLELDSEQATYDDMKKKAIQLEDKWGVRII
jgi:L1 cell adhesion molecule like protein